MEVIFSCRPRIDWMLYIQNHHWSRLLILLLYKWNKNASILVKDASLTQPEWFKAPCKKDGGSVAWIVNKTSGRLGCWRRWAHGSLCSAQWSRRTLTHQRIPADKVTAVTLRASDPLGVFLSWVSPPLTHCSALMKKTNSLWSLSKNNVLSCACMSIFIVPTFFCSATTTCSPRNMCINT